MGIYLSTDTLQVMHGSTLQVAYKHLTSTLYAPYTPILYSYTEVSQLIVNLEIYATWSLLRVKLYDL